MISSIQQSKICLCDSIDRLRTQLDGWRRAGDSLVLVPTMGNLHKGHLKLVEVARKAGQRVIVSIFVNPLQFGPGEDYDRYPRTLEADQAKLSQFGVDVLFIPPTTEIYPQSTDGVTYVDVPGLSEILCGASRPGHFRGVATVVVKLFNIVQPDAAVFGEKDYQQLQVIRCLVRDLNFPVKIIQVPTVREPDGLAMSSRNGYLTVEERVSAPRLYQILVETRMAIEAGEKDLEGLVRRQMEALGKSGFEPEYLEIRAPDLSLPEPGRRPLVILAAARLGQTRLIDNLIVP